jgi:Tfp pilus assembly protein PilX
MVLGSVSKGDVDRWRGVEGVTYVPSLSLLPIMNMNCQQSQEKCGGVALSLSTSWASSQAQTPASKDGRERGAKKKEGIKSKTSGKTNGVREC